MTVGKRLRVAMRTAAYRSGLFGFQRRRMRRALTVAMLHRVMDPNDPDFATADPEYTLSTLVFEQLLGFFSRHYSVVCLADVISARAGAQPLPEHALLITFDDGWADNLRYAAPLLKACGLPAVIFVAVEPVLSSRKVWWQEQIFAAARSGILSSWIARQTWGTNPPANANSSAAALAAIVCVGRFADQERANALASLPEAPYQRRMMLRTDELPKMADYGIALGLHGFSHLPLTEVVDVKAELSQARDALTAMSGGTAAIDALALPHSRYDDTVIDAAVAAGIKHIFTGDAHLESAPRGVLARQPAIGRIHLSARYVSDTSGHLDPAAAARWLWDRPCS
jgi:peptidoglycan/xylan/chitin deacetylase (PgdA/CDA1 family)